MRKYWILFLSVFVGCQANSQSLRDTVRLEAFMDGLIKTHLRDKHIAGATVAIIQDGKVLLAKGYGFSDLEKQTAVKADATLFRIGSVSKLFTWISVMQLVSQGKLKLDEDVNHYFKDFKIPQTYPEPVTLKDLMTHTPGFEDKVIGLFGRDSTSLKPLAEILSKEMPARVRPPGTFASYSNHGTGMAAYIVEQVSGMSFNDYVEKNILNPLGMNTTTFRQPLPARFKPLMSKGYMWEKGELKVKPFEFVPLYPVGAAASTATDMAKFMQAILQHGRLGSAQILDSATLTFMESPAHRHHPMVNAMRYGFMDVSQNGVTVIGHGGATFWFHTILALLPETNTGFFLSFNTDTGSGTQMQVLEEFMDTYFPEQHALKTPIKVDKEFLNRFIGSYRANRYAYHDITTVASILNDMVITVSDSSKIKVIQGEKADYYVPIDSLTFRKEHSSDVIAFGKNEKGEITHMFIGGMPILALDKVKGLQSAGLHTFIFISTMLIMLLVLFYWPFVSWIRSGYQSMRVTKSLPSSVRWLAWFDFLLLAIFYVGLSVAISDQFDIVMGLPASMKFILTIPLICIVLTVWMLVKVFQLIGDSRYRLTSRLFYVVITLAAITALWQLYYWNFIGFNY